MAVLLYPFYAFRACVSSDVKAWVGKDTDSTLQSRFRNPRELVYSHTVRWRRFRTSLSRPNGSAWKIWRAWQREVEKCDGVGEGIRGWVQRYQKARWYKDNTGIIFEWCFSLMTMFSTAICIAANLEDLSFSVITGVDAIMMRVTECHNQKKCNHQTARSLSFVMDAGFCYPISRLALVVSLAQEKHLYTCKCVSRF